MSEGTVLRVLYMEDDPGLARLVQKRLQREGYTIDIATAGDEGLAMFSRRPYDVLLVDQEMPVYSGLRVIQTLVSDNLLPPTIMLTGAGNEQTAVEAMKLGAGDYVVKDPSGGYLELLPTILQRVLDRHHLREEKEKAEEALRASEARFRTVTETAADAILCSEEGGKIVLWNHAAQRMFGYDSAEATEMDIGTVIPHFARPLGDSLHALLPRASRGTDSQHFESILKRKDGTAFPAEVSITGWRTRSETFYTTIIHDVSERKEYEARLAHMAHHDSLTGVFNRHHLATALERETARAQRYGHPIGFLMIDVDRFKMINDTLGHQKGDQVIVAVAGVIRAAVRRVDLVFRYGGDEFLVVLPETNGKTRHVKEHIIGALAEWNRTSTLLDFDVTLSIGVSHWMPGGAQTTDEALDQADAAMYREKRGRAPTVSMVRDSV